MLSCEIALADSTALLITSQTFSIGRKASSSSRFAYNFSSVLWIFSNSLECQRKLPSMSDTADSSAKKSPPSKTALIWRPAMVTRTSSNPAGVICLASPDKSGTSTFW
ncbi:MAG: hypothetical protein CM1200mP30_32640 [Pseudomonadota bacterium]|nr:MAG: hypothetical protein CM1200mP30_32640 [Pseudomonadota bacterium]